jgi:carotenoid cleavage dioxygenase
MSIDPRGRKISSAAIADLAVEFPRVNDTREARPTRFIYLPTLTGSLKLPHPPDDTFNTLLKIDAETGAVTRHDFGHQIAGEAVFIPRGGNREDDGYLAAFTFDPASRTSNFVLLDAAHVGADPIAVVRLPQRVPQGLHGTWIPKA